MLYDSYHKKISKVVDVLRKIFKHIVLISIISALLLALIIAFMATKGIVLDDKNAPEAFDLTYGEDFPFKANALFAKTSYEYSSDGEVWLSEFPSSLGEYKVRVSARSIFGQLRYGKIYSFNLKAKAVDLLVTDKQIVYGENPTVFAALVGGDSLICDNFVYGDRSLSKTTVTPDKSAVQILNLNGKDITNFYEFNAHTSEIDFLPREITVTVSDRQMIYNDTVLSFDGYELSEGTLAKGDILQAVFDKSIIDVGSIENTPQLSVVYSQPLESGDMLVVDVSSNYLITQIIGELRVDHRPLMIQTESASKVYDDSELSNPNYTIVGEYDVVDGHVVECESATSIIGAGEVENVLVLSIKNANGEDKTSNYSLFYERGTLKVVPRLVKIYSESATWEYDGKEHYTEQPTFEGFCPNHTVSFSWPSLIDVGTQHNMVTFKYVRDSEGRDALSNYEFTYENIGVIRVTKRPITITHQSSTTGNVYDGSERVFSEYTISSGSLADNESLDIVFPTFSQAGAYENKMQSATVICDRASGTLIVDLLKNYEVTEIAGTVVIDKCKLTLSALGNVKEYDGLSFSSEKYEIVSGTLPEQHNLNVVYIYSGTDVGDYYAEIDLRKTNITYMDNDVTHNFDISAPRGNILTITKREITVKLSDAKKAYDGSPLISSEYEIILGDLVSGHSLTLGSIGSQTEIGLSYNVIDEKTIKITDLSNSDVTKNYNVTVESGTLEVVLRKLSVTSNSEAKVYDGIELKGKEVTVDTLSEDNDGLIEGHSIQFTLPATVKNVSQGKVNNEIANFDILDQNGESVKQYYDVSQNIGILELLPIEITVTTGSDEKIYDGKPLGCLEYTSDYQEKLLAGDTIAIEIIGTITDVGEVSNEAHVTINGLEIAEDDNYKIIYNLGSLKITPIELHLIPTPSVTEKEYDATPLECIDYLMSGGQLLDGHKLQSVVFTSITDVGSVDVDVVGYQIINSDGDDVSSNYSIVIDESVSLTVTKRKIVIASDSATKLYDGRPLTAPNCTVQEGSVLEFHSLEVQASGSQTEEGSSNNTIGQDALIFDELGNDVAYNYEITYIEGTLTVTKKVVATVISSNGGDIYLKTRSYAEYNGQGFINSLRENSCFTSRGYECSYMLWLSNILNQSGYAQHNLVVSDAETYMLPYYMAISDKYDMPTYSEDYTTISSDRAYTVPYYDYSYVETGTSGLRGTSYDRSFRTYTTWVKNNYLDISNSTKNKLLSLVSSHGFTSLSTEYKIKEVASYISSIAVYNTNYDEALDSENDIAVAFLEHYREGSAKHYAIAATMLYRALGIPARYVEGYLVNTEANVATDVKNEHCWVEVFVDNYGWMRIEVTFGGEKLDISIKPKDVKEPYDGNVHKATEIEFINTSEDVKELFSNRGYKISADIIGSRVSVGVSDTSLENVKIYDYNGNDVTYKFNIALEQGTLEVTPIVINVCLYNISKTYDGTALSYSNDKFYSIRDEAFKQSGYVLTLSVTFTEVNVHRLTAASMNKNISDYVSFTVMNGTEDISRNYIINIVSYSEDVSEEEYVVAQINQRTLEITSASQTKYYTDGATLMNNTVNITKGSLVGGHVLIASANTKLAEIGSVENVIDPEAVYILDSGAEDVTMNYKITIKHGILTFLEQ